MQKERLVHSTKKNKLLIDFTYLQSIMFIITADLFFQIENFTEMLKLQFSLANFSCWNTNPTPGYMWIHKTPVVVVTVVCITPLILLVKTDID